MHGIDDQFAITALLAYLTVNFKRKHYNREYSLSLSILRFGGNQYRRRPTF